MIHLHVADLRRGWDVSVYPSPDHRGDDDRAATSLFIACWPCA
jgi:hypothetical protein